MAHGSFIGVVWRSRLLRNHGLLCRVLAVIPAPLAFLAIAAEFFGGLGLILGFLTRIAAFGIAMNMVVAIAMVHRAFGFFMNWTGAPKGEALSFTCLCWQSPRS